MTVYEFLLYSYMRRKSSHLRVWVDKDLLQWIMNNSHKKFYQRVSNNILTLWPDVSNVFCSLKNTWITGNAWLQHITFQLVILHREWNHPLVNDNWVVNKAQLNNKCCTTRDHYEVKIARIWINSMKNTALEQWSL